MAYSLFGVKSIFKPLLMYLQLDPLDSSPSDVHCLSPELAYLKHVNTKEIYFQEIVVSGNVLQW